MTWVKLDDNFCEHEKIAPLSDRAFRLHVAALCLCGRLLTDGRVTEANLRALAGLLFIRNVHKYVDELIQARLWGTVRAGEHRINDYLNYNPSSVQVKERRAADANRQAKYRKSHGVSHSAPTRPVINKEQLQTDDNQPQTAEIIEITKRVADSFGGVS